MKKLFILALIIGSISAFAKTVKRVELITESKGNAQAQYNLETKSQVINFTVKSNQDSKARFETHSYEFEGYEESFELRESLREKYCQKKTTMHLTSLYGIGWLKVTILDQFVIAQVAPEKLLVSYSDDSIRTITCK